MSNMAAAVASLKENVQNFNEALEKTEKLLLKRIQNGDGKIDEQEEMAQLILNEGIKRNMADAVDSFTKNLGSPNESFENETELFFQMAEDVLGKSVVEKKQVVKMTRSDSFEKEMEIFFQMAEDVLGKSVVEKKLKQVDKMTAFESVEGVKRNMADAVDRFTENLQSSNEAREELSILSDLTLYMSAREKENKDLLQRVNEKMNEQRELLERIKKEVCDPCRQFGIVNDRLNYLTETVGKSKERKPYLQRAQDRMDRVEKKKADRMAWFEAVEKLYYQKPQDLTGKIDGVEKKQGCIVARKSHGDSFADQ